MKNLDKFKVLVIDDEKDITDLLVEIMSDHPTLEVTERNLPNEAIALLNEEPFDLVLTDFRMPQMNGGELIRHVREKSSQNREIPILFVTANPNEAKQFTLEYEDIHILEKPIHFEALAKMIIKTLMNKR